MTGLSAEERRAIITACYERSDGAEAFRGALVDHGYILARGDRRGFVLVDQGGDVFSLSRYVKGHSAKQIRERLAPLVPEDLPAVEKAKELAKALQRDRGEDTGKGESDGGGKSLAEARQALADRQAKRRQALAIKEQELLTRQQAERLSLKAAQKADERQLFFKARSAVADMIARTPGLRSVLRPLQELTGLDPREKHRLQVHALTERHQRERAGIAREKRLLSRIESRENRALARAEARELERALAATGLKETSRNAARNAWSRGEVSYEFNETGEFVEGGDQSLTPDPIDEQEIEIDEREETRQRNQWSRKRDKDRGRER